MFHKILKSGCKAEESKLRTAQRLANLISVFCILSWRVFWMTMLNRSAPDAPPDLALTEAEIGLLDHLMKDKDQKPLRRKTLSHYLTKIARLGGYLARASDPPPGNTRSCGADCRASLTSNWAPSSGRKLWVIERFTERLRTLGDRCLRSARRSPGANDQVGTVRYTRSRSPLTPLLSAQCLQQKNVPLFSRP